MVAVEAQCAGLPVLASADVPRECVVVSDLMQFKNIESGEAAWAGDLLRLVGQSRDVEGSNRQVSRSAFSIESSAQALLRVYGPGFSS